MLCCANNQQQVTKELSKQKRWASRFIVSLFVCLSPKIMMVTTTSRRVPPSKLAVAAVAILACFVVNNVHAFARPRPYSLKEWQSMALQSATHGVAAAPCPCDQASWCTPLTTPKPQKELFVYTPNEAMYDTSYNWTLVTSVVTYTLPQAQFVCYAHARGVRVILAVGTDWSVANHPESRASFAASVATTVANNGLDGINMDFEENFNNPMNSSEVTSLYFLTVAAVKNNNPLAQTSICIGTFWWWTATPETYYPYDFAALLSQSDFLMAMMYDMSTQAVGPNSKYSAINVTFQGLYQVASMAPSQLVLGFPWYGYEYYCQNGTLQNGTCTVHGSTEVCYDGIIAILNQQNPCYGAPSAVTHVLDPTRGTYAYFSVTHLCDPDGTPDHLFVYDDPETLDGKYRLSMTLGAKGLSMWQATCLGNSTVSPMPEARQQMWEAINSYF